LSGHFNASNASLGLSEGRATVLNPAELWVSLTCSQPGRYSGSIAVQTTARSLPTVNITVEVCVVGPVIDVTPACLDFDNVKVGSSRLLPVTISNTGTADAMDVQVNTQPFPACFHFIDANPHYSGLPAGKSYDQGILFQPVAAGDAQAVLTVKYRYTINSPFEDCQAGLQGRGTVPVMKLPAAVDFGSVDPGTEHFRILQILNTGDAELVVSKVGLDWIAWLQGFCIRKGGYIYQTYEDVPIVIQPQDAAAIEIMFTAKAGGGVCTGDLLIESDDPQKPHGVVPLRGVSIGPPRIGVLPERIEFGKLPRGQPFATREAKIRNDGAADLTVTAVRIEGTGADPLPPFLIWRMLPRPPAKLSPRQELLLNVAFTARNPGDYVGTLCVESDDPSPERATVRVPVHGGRS
jgi:hypothetical protein